MPPDPNPRRQQGYQRRDLNTQPNAATLGSAQSQGRVMQFPQEWGTTNCHQRRPTQFQDQHDSALAAPSRPSFGMGASHTLQMMNAAAQSCQQSPFATALSGPLPVAFDATYARQSQTRVVPSHSQLPSRSVSAPRPGPYTQQRPPCHSQDRPRTSCGQPSPKGLQHASGRTPIWRPPPPERVSSRPDFERQARPASERAERLEHAQPAYLLSSATQPEGDHRRPPIAPETALAAATTFTASLTQSAPMQPEPSIELPHSSDSLISVPGSDTMAAPTATALRRLDVAPLINTPERATSSDAARETGSFEGPPTRYVTADGDRNDGVMVHEENNGTFARFRPHHSVGYFASSAGHSPLETPPTILPSTSQPSPALSAPTSISPTKLVFFETPKAKTATSAPSHAPSHASAPHRDTIQTSIGVNIPCAPPAPNPSTKAMYASLDGNIFYSPQAPGAWPATSIAGQNGVSWSTALPNMGVNNLFAMSMGPLEPGGSVMGGGGRGVDPSRQQRQRYHKAPMQAPRHHEGRPPHQVTAVQTALYERGGLPVQMDARGTGWDARSRPLPPDAPETVQQPPTSLASTSIAPINPLNAMPVGPSIKVSSTLLSHLHPVQAQRAEYMPYFGAHAGWAPAQAPTPSSAPAPAPAAGTTLTASVSADLSILAGPKEWASEMWGDNPTPDLGRPDAEHTLGMPATPATGADQSLGPEPALGPPFVFVESTQPVLAGWQSSPLGENLHATSLPLPMPTSAPQHTTPQHATSAVPVYTSPSSLSYAAPAPLHARQQTPPTHASLGHEALQNRMGSSPHTAVRSLIAESSDATAWCAMPSPTEQVVQHDAGKGGQSQSGQVAQNLAQQAPQHQTQQAPQTQRQALSHAQQFQLAQQSEAWKALQLRTLQERTADRGEAQPQSHASGQVQAHALASTQKQEQQQQQFPLQYMDEDQRQGLQQRYGRASQGQMPPRLAAQRAQQQQILDVRLPQRQQAELQQTYTFLSALDASPAVPHSPSDQVIEVKPDPDNTDEIVYFNGQVWWFIGWMDPRWLDKNMTVEHLKRTLRLHGRTHSVNKPSLIKLLSTWARDKRDKWALEGVMPRWEPPEESERGSARRRQPKRPRVISQGSFSIDPAIVNLLQGYIVRNEADARAIAEQRGADPELYAWHFRRLASGTLNVKPEIIDILESPAPSATPAFHTAAAQYQHYPAPQQYPPQQHYPPQPQYPGQQQQALTIRMTDPVRITSPAETHAIANAKKATQASEAAVALAIWSSGRKRKGSADERLEPAQRARLDRDGALASGPFLTLPGISRTPTPGSPATAQRTTPSVDVAEMSRAIIETIKPISAPTGSVTATEPPSALPAMENDEPRELGAPIPVDDDNNSVFDIAQEGSLFYASEEDEHQEQDIPSVTVEQPVVGGVGAPSNDEQQPPTIYADPLLLGTDLMPVDINLGLGIDMSWVDIPGMTEFLSSFTEEEVAAFA